MARVDASASLGSTDQASCSPCLLFPLVSFAYFFYSKILNLQDFAEALDRRGGPPPPPSARPPPALRATSGIGITRAASHTGISGVAGLSPRARGM